MGKRAGRACPAPTGWREIDRALLIKSYSLTQSLHKRYMFPLDVTGWMVYTVGRRTVLSYYILYQFIPILLPDLPKGACSLCCLAKKAVMPIAPVAISPARISARCRRPSAATWPAKRSTYAALMNPAAPCCTNAARRAGIWGRCPIELYSVLCLRYTTIK